MLEGLFGGVFSVMFGYEPLTRELILGGIIIMAGLIIMELDYVRPPKESDLK